MGAGWETERVGPIAGLGRVFAILSRRQSRRLLPPIHTQSSRCTKKSNVSDDSHLVVSGQLRLLLFLVEDMDNAKPLVVMVLILQRSVLQKRRMQSQCLRIMLYSTDCKLYYDVTVMQCSSNCASLNHACVNHN